MEESLPLKPPKTLLGRITSVGAYVKRGEESGSINITLRGNNEDEHIVITCKINTNNESEWLLNGNIVPKTNVVETVKMLNIQINNFTQFLSLDRVCEFAKLTPVQFLEEIEKFVGDPQLFEQHRALVDKSNALKNIEVTILYLLSLLDITDVPFRVLDEINRGINPRNERKMFRKLVIAASKPDTPQCFLLTPELLRDLQNSEACTILNMMHDPWVHLPTNIWKDGEPWSILRGHLGESHC